MKPRSLLSIALTAALVGLAACAGPGGVQREVPPPALKLVASTPLELPVSCIVDGPVAVEFAVLPTGRTAEIVPVSGPECARTALATWVASFRYVEPAQRTPSRIECLVVSASRKT
jgi:hypothetical protein